MIANLSDRNATSNAIFKQFDIMFTYVDTFDIMFTCVDTLVPIFILALRL